jgi:hypothetical protein
MATGIKKTTMNLAAVRHTILVLLAGCMLLTNTGCFHYSFSTGSVPKAVKTIKINYIDNKARYVNPQLSPQLSQALRDKVTSQTGKTLVQGDNADYEISGWVADYSFSTAAISGNKTASNRLTITVHIVFKNHLDPTGKTVTPADFEKDVSRSFDFDANISIQQAESQLNDSILKNLTDEIFNQIFSNW